MTVYYKEVESIIICNFISLPPFTPFTPFAPSSVPLWINIKVSNKGDTIISADADGIVKVWDIRMVQELGTIDLGHHPINSIGLDRGEAKAMCASDDGTIKVIDIQNFTKISELAGHDTAVQCLSIAPNDSYVVSGSSDACFKVWSKWLWS